MSAALACSGIGVRLGGSTVLDRVDLEVAVGEWVAVVGPNGAGKTTLLRAICGLVHHDGVVEIAGRPTAGTRRRDLARSVGMVPQVPVVPPGIRVSEYVLLGRTAHLGTFAQEGPADLAAVAAALERLDLGPFAAREVDTLSGGERQRVVLARLLAQGAPLALLDEPTSSLDIGHEQRVLDLVDDLRRTDGLTVVSTLHDLSVAARYADRIALLAGGRMVAVGKPAEILRPDLLRRHYGAEVAVLEGPDGPVVVATRGRR